MPVVCAQLEGGCMFKGEHISLSLHGSPSLLLESVSRGMCTRVIISYYFLQVLEESKVKEETYTSAKDSLQKIKEGGNNPWQFCKNPWSIQTICQCQQSFTPLWSCRMSPYRWVWVSRNSVTHCGSLLGQALIKWNAQRGYQAQMLRTHPLKLKFQSFTGA